MTFKQKVEEIVKQIAIEAEQDRYIDLSCDTDFMAIFTDRILAAYKERVEGMPQIPRRYLRGDGYWGYDFSEEREAGAEKQLEACKKYMLEGLDDN